MTATAPNRTLLVVEDEGVALPLRCVLQRAGHDVVQVGRLVDTPPTAGEVTLVVVDVGGEDRRCLVRDLGELVPEPAVVLLTSGPGPHGWAGALTGNVAVLPKPFAVGEFLACLRVLMGSTATRVPAPRSGAGCDDVGPGTVVGQVPQNVV